MRRRAWSVVEGHGSIEGPTRRAGAVRRGGVFRGLRTTASLKLPLRGGVIVDDRDVPWPNATASLKLLTFGAEGLGQLGVPWPSATASLKRGVVHARVVEVGPCSVAIGHGL